MHVRALTATLMIIALCHPVQGQDKPDASAGGHTVTVVGLRVFDDSIPLDKMKRNPSWVDDGETSVLLAVRSKTNLIKLERRKSSLKITDGQGNDLLKSKDGKKSRFSFSPYSQMQSRSDDGHLLLISVDAPRAPAKGSGNINLEGVLQIEEAGGMKTVSAKADMKPGAVAFKGLKVKIEDSGMEKDWFDKDVFFIKLSMQGAAATEFSGIRFLDDKGAEIESKSHSSSSGMGHRSAKYHLTTGDLASCTIELDLWDKMATVKVPFKVSVPSPL